MHAYLKVFDQKLAYDFDMLVPGRHSNPSTRDDVNLVKAYVMDIMKRSSVSISPTTSL
jgi:hypothetical protein